MFRQMLYGKIHGACVTEACVDYQGSITIDGALLKAADILPGEKVLIANLTNGSRIESYTIEGKPGSGVIGLNGGAAKHGKVGDRLIIMCFAVMTAEEIENHEAKVIRVNEKNEIIAQMVVKAG
mgnify:CR=1 FL=1